MFKRQTVAEGLVEVLREAILNGDIPEGEQLRQDAIAKKYDVSRIPVREALRQLEAEGLIISQAHRSAVVASLSLKEVEELFEIRAALEPKLLETALPHLTEGDFARAEQTLDDYDKALEEGDVAQWGELNRTFHNSLFEKADRAQTLAIINSLGQKVDRYTRMQLQFTDGVRRAQDEHREILRLCRAGKGEDASKLLEDHILNAGRSLVAYLAKKHEDE